MVVTIPIDDVIDVKKELEFMCIRRVERHLTTC
jgi:hypothetical protein